MVCVVLIRNSKAILLKRIVCGGGKSSENN